MVENEDIHEQEPAIKTANINLISFNSNHSGIVVKLKKSSKEATIMVAYKVETGCNGDLMPFNILKLFPSTTEDTTVATKDTGTL